MDCGQRNRLGEAVGLIVEVYMEYTAQGGKKCLMKTELPNVLEKEVKNKKLRAAMNRKNNGKDSKKVDGTEDEEVDFKEFAQFVCKLAKKNHKIQMGCDQKKKQDTQASE